MEVEKTYIECMEEFKRCVKLGNTTRDKEGKLKCWLEADAWLQKGRLYLKKASIC